MYLINRGITISQLMYGIVLVLMSIFKKQKKRKGEVRKVLDYG